MVDYKPLGSGLISSGVTMLGMAPPVGGQPFEPLVSAADNGPAEPRNMEGENEAPTSIAEHVWLEADNDMECDPTEADVEGLEVTEATAAVAEEDDEELGVASESSEKGEWLRIKGKGRCRSERRRVGERSCKGVDEAVVAVTEEEEVVETTPSEGEGLNAGGESSGRSTNISGTPRVLRMSVGRSSASREACAGGGVMRHMDLAGSAESNWGGTEWQGRPRKPVGPAEEELEAENGFKGMDLAEESDE